MAKGKGGAQNSPEGMSKKQNVKLADIYTAAKSTMEPCDYWQGYPANDGELLNQNFSGKRK